MLKNLMPYWINNYFKEDNYLKVDNKPVLCIYNLDNFLSVLGDVEKGKSTVKKMKEMCVAAGFNGLVLWGQYCAGNPFAEHQNFKEMVFDAVISYAVPTFAKGALPDNKNTFTAEQLIKGHKYYWDAQQKSSLTYIPTVSMGFDSSPWGDSTSLKKWRLSPDDFKTVCKNAYSF